MECVKCKKEIPEESVYCMWCGKKQVTTAAPIHRRCNGTGTVYRRDGNWAAMVTLSLYRDENGKYKRKTATKQGFPTKKAAIDYIATLYNTEKKVKAKTLLQVYRAWWPTHKAGKSTMGNYDAAWKYFRPLWYMPIGEIDIDDLQDCLDDCPRGKRTKENMKALCGLLYKYAIPRHLVTLNLGQYLVIHAESEKWKSGLSLDDLEKIRSSEAPYADYVLCHCYLGFRPSELLSMTDKSYDPTEKCFRGGSKTEAGKNRVVTVSPKIQPIIDRLTAKPGYVFCDASGQQMSLDKYRAAFYDVLDSCGIKNPVQEINGVKFHKYSPHSCRHTFATLMKRVEGADKDKLELIGHTSSSMLREYQDVDLADLKKITDQL